MPDHERDAGEAQKHAEPLARAQPLMEESRSDERREKRLRGDDERHDAGRHAEVLGVVAAAELHRVHEQARDREVRERRGAAP